ncbi:MAG: hypothetical protein IJ077_08440 [Eubacterium sp.]|nr:hypothetical protein [Eubacterium sp.]
MENLDKYLKKIEENLNHKTKEYEIKIGSLGETMKIRTLTLSEQREWYNSMPIGGSKVVGDFTNNQTMRKIVYNVMNLNEIAVAAKEKGLINTYYDVLDYLFTAEELADILSNIQEHISLQDDEVNDLKN